MDPDLVSNCLQSLIADGKIRHWRERVNITILLLSTTEDKINNAIITKSVNARIQRGGADPPPPENHKNIGFLSNTGPDHLTNDKAAKPAYNVRPSSARQQNAI